MDAPSAIFCALVLFTAYLVRGVAGFGSALIAVPLLALVLPLTIVVPLVVLLDYLGSASQGIKNRELIAWRDLLPLVPFTLVGVITGLLVMDRVDASLMQLVLGTFVILFAVYQLLPVPQWRGSRITCVPLGYLGGLVGTLFGTGGPFYVVYLTLRGLDKGPFRASIATNFLIDGSMRLVGYATFGFYNREALALLLMALPVAGLGLYVGGHIHTRLGKQMFLRIISFLLVGSGTALLLKT